MTTNVKYHMRMTRSAKNARAYDLPTLLTYRLLVLSNTLGKGAVRLYATRYGVPLAEWRLLAALALEAQSSVNALAAVLSTDKGWVSRIARSLIEKQLVVARPDPSDARRTEIALSPGGKALYARILPAAMDRQQRLLEVLSAAERTLLDQLLVKLQRQAAILAEPPTLEKNDQGRTNRSKSARRTGITEGAVKEIS